MSTSITHRICSTRYKQTIDPSNKNSLLVTPVKLYFITTAFITHVQNQPLPLIHASPELKNNYEVVLASVTQNGLNLEHANARLQANASIVFAAIRQNPDSEKFANKELVNFKNLLNDLYKKLGSNSNPELWETIRAITLVFKNQFSG